MLAECAHDWQAVADVWGFFENHGMSPALLEVEAVLPRAPLAVLGCGRGGVLSFLQARLGTDGVHGLDSSARMVEAARQRGCVNVRWVAPDAPDLGIPGLASIVVSTGVLDPLEPDETRALLSQLYRQVDEGGSLWVYAFGRFGPNWTISEALGATRPLGIANDRLFDLYERAEATSLESALSEFDIAGRGRLAAKTWLLSIRRFLSGVTRELGHDQRQALQFLRSVSPAVQRRFAREDVCSALEQVGFRIESVREHQQAGVLRIIARSNGSGSGVPANPPS